MKGIALITAIMILAGCLPPQAKIKVRNPKSDMPWVHEVGWWPYQEALSIRKCEVRILDSRLGLFNSRSLIEVQIEGELKEEAHRRPYIAQVHLAERLTKRGQHSDAEAEFTMTPVVEIKDDAAYAGDAISFSIKQERILRSLNWGQNRFKFLCGPIEQTIEVLQGK